MFKIETTLSCPTYPKVWCVRIKLSNYFATMSLTGSPVANCQTFSVGNITDIIDNRIEHDCIKSLLSTFCSLTFKKQMLIDVNISYLDKIIEKISKFIISYDKMDYISTNGSKMSIVLVKLNLEELR